MKFSYDLLKKIFPAIPSIKESARLLDERVFEVDSVDGPVLDIKILPNRYGDCASHAGIARELAIVSDKKFTYNVPVIINQPADLGTFSVKIEEPKLCRRYAARRFELAHPVGPAPVWMKKILAQCGIGSINAVVDTLNYAMLETGQPLHAFDAAKLANYKNTPRLIVRRARAGEPITTLDGRQLELSQNVLVIADDKQALAVAGIKGGMSAGISNQTHSIIVEAATFDPVSIFLASRATKLATDASIRFAHGLSSELVQIGIDRATQLLVKECGAKIVDSIDYYPHPQHHGAILFDARQYARFIGTPIPVPQAKKLLQKAGFEIAPAMKNKKQEDVFLVRPPAIRTDIEIPEDIYEEVLRMRGIDSVVAIPPAITMIAPFSDEIILTQELARDISVAAGTQEVYNSSFIARGDYERISAFGGGVFEGGFDLCEVENPISEDKKYLRPSLMPLLFKSIAENAKFFESVNIFEVGHVSAQLPAKNQRPEKTDEAVSWGLALYEKDSPLLIARAKGVIERLVEGLGLPTAQFDHNDEGVVHVKIGTQRVGCLVHEQVAKRVYATVAELNLSALSDMEKIEKQFHPFPKYPAVTRDISIIIGGDIRIGEVIDEITQIATKQQLVQTDLIDEYTDEEKFSGKQGLSFRLLFQSPERSLTDDEVNAVVARIHERLRERFNAQVR